MYTVDQHDTVAELPGVPRSSVGAPLPVVLACEHALLLAYLLEDAPDDWDGTSIGIVTGDSEDVAVALVEFVRPYAHFLGPPNDEAFDGHPLSERGLHPYGTFVVRRSSWLRRLERMNSVHPSHDPRQFDELQHFVFAFHDSTFECVARGLRCSVHPGPLAALLPEMQRRTMRSLA